MQTKLVYVLTCADSGTYIEQALMSVYSARYWNPDAYIVLIVDDRTDLLIRNSRSEILHYISEKKVITFKDSSLSMLYRSRWLKTNVRQLVEGDFLFIDCDTVVTSDLSDIDYVQYDLAMVPDEHLPISEYDEDLQNTIFSYATKLGWNIKNERFYFNSGVMYVKDTSINRDFFKTWHSEWLLSEGVEIKIDQPSLAKTNAIFNHHIRCLPNEWNCLVYMRPLFISKSKILHFWGFRNMSFMYGGCFLDKVKHQGIANKFINKMVLNPIDSLLPFPNMVSSYNLKNYFLAIRNMRKLLNEYAFYIDAKFNSFPWLASMNKVEQYCLYQRLYIVVSCLFYVRHFVKIKLLHRKDNSIVSFR